MTWVITRLCRDCVDESCVEVCPVDCIYEYTGSDAETFPNQLYIDPEECINCGVCEPECPWEAIFEDEQVPELFADDTTLNARILDDKDEFSVPSIEHKLQFRSLATGCPNIVLLVPQRSKHFFFKYPQLVSQVFDFRLAGLDFIDEKLVHLLLDGAEL